MQNCKKECSKCNKYFCYQIGYKEGLKAGLLQANEIVGQLLKEQQDRINTLYECDGSVTSRLKFTF